MSEFDRTQMIPSDDEMDQLLREAGARMRATAPGIATPAPRREEHRRNRWIVPVTLGAVAAAVIALLVGLARDPEESLTNVPAETLPPTVPVSTLPPAPSTTEPTPTTVTPTTVTPTTVAGTGDPEVTDVGWDGDGSACVRFGGVTGCFPGGSLSSEPAFAFVKSGTDVRFMTVTQESDGGMGVSHEASGMECELPDPDGWYVDVVCGPLPLLYGTLPSEPAGGIAYGTFRTESGDPVPLELVSTGVQTADGAQPGFQTFRATLEDLQMTCWLVVPDGLSQRYETCRPASEPQPADGIVAFEQDGRAYGLRADGTLVDVTGGVPWTNGCTDPLEALLEQRPAETVMMSSFACDGDRATSTFGPVFVQFGPPDGGINAYERNELGAWIITDTGTGIDPQPAALPLPTPELLVRDELDLPAVDVTSEIQDIVGGPASPDDIWSILESALTVEGEGLPPTATFYDHGASQLIAIELSYADDSIGSGTTAVWLAPSPDGGGAYLVDRAFRSDRCSRGITDDGLCV